MADIITENMFQEAKKNFENRLKTCFDFLRKPTVEETENLLTAFEDAVRDTFIVQVVAPHSFPAALIHDGDYYDSESLEPKLDPAAVIPQKILDYGDALDGWV